MAGHPLRPATDRRLGEPLPHQLANQTRVHRMPQMLFTLLHAKLCTYAVLAPVSKCYPPAYGRLPTRYSPVRHSLCPLAISKSVRLACVKHAASVHPEPGSNSHVKKLSCQFFLWLLLFLGCDFRHCLFLFSEILEKCFLWEFSGLHYCSFVKVLCCF